VNLTSGSRVGPYVLGRQLSSTEAGTVWAASEPGAERSVAVRIMPLPNDPEERLRILDGLRRLAGVEHPGLAPVYAAGEAGGSAWIASRIPQGRTLESAGPLRPARRDRLRDDVSAAIRALAAAGIAPASVTSGDVLLDGDRATLVPADAAGGSNPDPALRALSALTDGIPVRGWHRSRVVAAAGLAAVAVTAGVFALTRGGDDGPPVTGPAGTVVATIPFPGYAGSMAFIGDRGWVADERGIRRLDTRTNTLVGAPVPFPGGIGGWMKAHDGALWFANGEEISRVDPDTLRLVRRAPLPSGADQFAFGGGRLWVEVTPPGRNVRGRLVPFDPESLEPEGAPVELPYGRPFLAGGDPAAMWVTNNEGGTVTRVDAVTGRAETTVVGYEAGLVNGDDPEPGFWAAAGNAMVRLDEDGDIARVLDIGSLVRVSVVSGDSVWLLSDGIRRIDRRTGTVVGTPVPLDEGGFVWEGLGDLWVTTEGSLLRIRATDPSPAVSGPAPPPTGVPAPGPMPAGTRLTPAALDVPVSLEAPSADWIFGSPDQPDAIFLAYRRATSTPLSVELMAPRQVFDQRMATAPVTGADALLDHLAARPDLRLGPRRAVTIAGVRGVRVDVRSVASRPIEGLCATPCSPAFPLAEAWTIVFEPGEPRRLTVFETGGRVHVASHLLGPEAPAAYRSEAERIIASFRREGAAR